MVSGAILGASVTQKKALLPSRGSGSCWPRSAHGSLVLLVFASPPACAGKLSHLVLSIYVCHDSCWKELVACLNPVTLARQQGRETLPRRPQAVVRGAGRILLLGMAVTRSRLAMAKSKAVMARVGRGQDQRWPWPRLVRARFRLAVAKSKVVMAQVHQRHMWVLDKRQALSFCGLRFLL